MNPILAVKEIKELKDDETFQSAYFSSNTKTWAHKEAVKKMKYLIEQAYPAPKKVSL